MGAIELGCPYRFYNPSRTQYFALNDPTDENFVGYVTDITGLDDSGVRENAQVVVAGDGGYHGPFWRDRRPWTFSGIIWPTMPVLARDRSQELMEGVFGQALKTDGFVEWTPADGVARRLKFRKQQPTRMSKGQSNVEKLFQLAGVSADWRITAVSQSSVSTSGGGNTGSDGAWVSNPAHAVNNGNADAAPIFTVYGPISPFTIAVYYPDGTNKQLSVKATLSHAGDFMTIDLTGPYPQVQGSSESNLYGSVDPLGTDWSIAIGPTPSPNYNTLYVWENGPRGSATADTYLQTSWYDSWL